MSRHQGLTPPNAIRGAKIGNPHAQPAGLQYFVILFYSFKPLIYLLS